MSNRLQQTLDYLVQCRRARLQLCRQVVQIWYFNININCFRQIRTNILFPVIGEQKRLASTYQWREEVGLKQVIIIIIIIIIQVL